MTLPLWLLMALVAVVVGGVTTVIGRTPPGREPAVINAARHARRTSAFAVLAGLIAALGCGVVCLSLLTGPGVFGRVLLLIPLAAGVAHAVVLALGELAWPRPGGDIRRAALVRRGLFDAAPRGLVRAAAAGLGVTVAVLFLGALAADHTGRTLTVGGLAARLGPFPGLHYGGPVAAGLLVLVLTTAVALHVVAQRAAVATAEPEVETVLRRASAHRVLRGTTAAVLALAAELLLMVGSTLREAVALTGPAAPAGIGVTGVAVLIAAAVAGAAAVAVACWQAPTVPADGRVSAS
ncbi:hypothetical protein [Geodermatophilus sp. FMUSA9-8]|uniref:hypothetical protein n=1 Tax=Geodermatophilus sp. FMUSA9-8 TaxID=3120155 RepID=UPI00300B2D8D